MYQYGIWGRLISEFNVAAAVNFGFGIFQKLCAVQFQDRRGTYLRNICTEHSVNQTVRFSAEAEDGVSASRTTDRQIVANVVGASCDIQSMGLLYEDFEVICNHPQAG